MPWHPTHSQCWRWGHTEQSRTTPLPQLVAVLDLGHPKVQLAPLVWHGTLLAHIKLVAKHDSPDPFSQGCPSASSQCAHISRVDLSNVQDPALETSSEWWLSSPPICKDLSARSLCYRGRQQFLPIKCHLQTNLVYILILYSSNLWKR